MISRKAAEAVYDEVDRIRADWPHFNHRFPQVPVRWHKRQGLEELYETYREYAYHLSGLPGGWAIPDEAHVFFELPDEPYGVREYQQADAVGRERPDPALWATAYQSGLEAGLDEDGEIRPSLPPLEEDDPWDAFSNPQSQYFPLPPEYHSSEPGMPEGRGLDPYQEQSGPRRSRGIYLKRSFHSTHDQVTSEQYTRFTIDSSNAASAAFLNALPAPSQDGQRPLPLWQP